MNSLVMVGGLLLNKESLLNICLIKVSTAESRSSAKNIFLSPGAVLTQELRYVRFNTSN